AELEIKTIECNLDCRCRVVDRSQLIVGGVESRHRVGRHRPRACGNPELGHIRRGLVETFEARCLILAWPDSHFNFLDHALRLFDVLRRARLILLVHPWIGVLWIRRRTFLRLLAGKAVFLRNCKSVVKSLERFTHRYPGIAHSPKCLHQSSQPVGWCFSSGADTIFSDGFNGLAPRRLPLFKRGMLWVG